MPGPLPSALPPCHLFTGLERRMAFGCGLSELPSMSGFSLNTSMCVSRKRANSRTQLEIPNQSQFFNSSVTVCALTVGLSVIRLYWRSPMTGTHLERGSAESPQRASGPQYDDEQNCPASHTTLPRRDRARGHYVLNQRRTDGAVTRSVRQ